jgi:peptide deformylase
MAVLKVARLGHPVLRRVAEPVSPEAIRSPEIQRLIDDMLETMDDHDGAGLAAPQVHVSRRVVIYGVEDWEGCLSVPDLRGMVPRWTTVRVEGADRSGRPVRFTATDFHARVVQHECDHLDGHVYLDRMRSMESLTFLPEFHRYWLKPQE